jgi:hypothetical protein
MSKKPRGPINFGKYERSETSPILREVHADTTFSFKYICTDQHAPQRCQYGQLKSFNDKIRMLCDLTWPMIVSSPKETNGYEELPQDAISRTIPERANHKDGLLVFTFGGRSGSSHSGRMVGFRRGHTFYVLFVDSRLDLYDHS